MGREVRRVPEKWEHPKNKNGEYIPLFEGCDLEAHLEEWEKYHESEPNPKMYMPRWGEGGAIWYMMYETCTEGTPISPAFKTPEELAQWLTDNNASAFAGRTATYKQWFQTIQRGFAPSAILDSRGLRSGVEALGKQTSFP